MGAFAYSADLIERFPSTRGGVIHATGLENGPAAPDLLAAYGDWQAEIRAEIGETPLSQLPEVVATVTSGSGARIRAEPPRENWDQSFSREYGPYTGLAT